MSENLGPSDFTTDEDDSNDDGDSGRETRTSRRRMKNIRQKRRPQQDTPKKKTARELGPSPSRVAQPAFLIKDILSREKQEQVGARRHVPREFKRQKVDAQRSEKPSWVLPPLPVLKVCGTMREDSAKVPERL